MLLQSKNLPTSIPEITETVRVVDSARHLERGITVSQVRFLPAQSGLQTHMFSRHLPNGIAEGVNKQNVMSMVGRCS